MHWLQTPDQHLYTMCHELGHGWGLPHTDENHLNRDRGDRDDVGSSTKSSSTLSVMKPKVVETALAFRLFEESHSTPKTE